MKLTESKIKQIIKEELDSILEQETDQPEKEPQQKMQTDVANIQKFLPKIDNVKEYNELVQMIMKHDFGNEQQKVTVLRKLRDLINKLIK